MSALDIVSTGHLLHLFKDPCPQILDRVCAEARPFGKLIFADEKANNSGGLAGFAHLIS